MEKTCEEKESESSSAGILDVPGEPAIVVNGVPNMAQMDDISTSTDTTSDSESEVDPRFGQWLEGRGVRKLFGDRFFSGMVVKFDQESNWYRVVYEDNDFEDLDWHELQEVLVPLDIAIPLNALALKTHKHDKTIDGSVENAPRSRKNHVKYPSITMGPVEAGCDAPVLKRRRGRPRKENSDGLKERRRGRPRKENSDGPKERQGGRPRKENSDGLKGRPRGRPRKVNVDGLKERGLSFGNSARAENEKQKESIFETNMVDAKVGVLIDSGLQQRAEAESDIPLL